MLTPISACITGGLKSNEFPSGLLHCSLINNVLCTYKWLYDYATHWVSLSGWELFLVSRRSWGQIPRWLCIDCNRASLNVPTQLGSIIRYGELPCINTWLPHVIRILGRFYVDVVRNWYPWPWTTWKKMIIYDYAWSCVWRLTHKLNELSDSWILWYKSNIDDMDFERGMVC